MERRKSYIETEKHGEENMISEGGPVYYTPEPPAPKLEPLAIPALESPIPKPELPVPQKGSERFSLEKIIALISQGLIGVAVGVAAGRFVLEYIVGAPMSIQENPFVVATTATLGVFAAWGTAEISKRILR